jgi:hypothetical protein
MELSDAELLDALDAPCWNRLREQLPDWDPDLSGAFIDRDLAGFDLSRADLTGADLSSASLSGGFLTGPASVEDAVYDEQTVWPDGFDVDESGAREAELQGEGERFDIFLSYAHDDRALAERISEALAGVELSTFMAEASLWPGDDWHESIREAIGECDSLLLLLTPTSRARPWLTFEAGAAWALGKPVIPAYRGILTSEIPDPLKRFQARAVIDDRAIRELARELAAND